jgi:hypothetical protein
MPKLMNQYHCPESKQHHHYIFGNVEVSDNKNAYRDYHRDK